MATSPSTPAFSIDVSEVKGLCPAGEVYAKQNIEDGMIPVLSCEGPCLRGEVARLAANIVTAKNPYARCCYAEALLVPHSSMAEWMKSAEKVVVIDGCFLSCMGRILENVVDKQKIIHIDAYPLYKEYSDAFLYTDVPEDVRNELAGKVADQILEKLGQQ